MSNYKLRFAALAALLLSSCVPAEGEDTFGENSPMAAIQADGVLRVAVPADRPPFAQGGALDAQGFAVELARGLAADLDVDLSIATLPVADMREAVGGSDPTEFGDGRVDVAFTLEPLTQELFKLTSQEEGFEVTTPYFVAHQRLLVPSDAGITDVADLGDKSVCSILPPEAGVPVDEISGAIEIAPAADPAFCASGLSDGDFEAVTGFDDVLLTAKALGESQNGPDTEIVGDQLATAGYPVVVDQGMAGYVSGVLNDLEEAGAWSDAYEQWIQPLSDEEPVPPEITLEDAAAIYPAEVP